MAQPIYRRGQAVRILWQAFCRVGVPIPHKDFVSRIKRLLDVDRSLKNKDHAPHDYSFIDEKPAGTGQDAALTEFNIFCLGLALELLDAGFKQGEVVYLLRHTRNGFYKEFKRIVDRGIVFTRQTLAPIKNVATSRDGKFADPRVFGVINKVELKEVFSPASAKKPSNDPMILIPRIFDGAVALADFFEEGHIGFSSRKALVVELWSLAMQIREGLADPPEVKRGPQSRGR